MSTPIVEARGVSRVFPMPAGPVVALHDLDLVIAAGDYMAICGPSGCGKSTLLHILGCVDTPTAGTLRVGGREVSSLRDAERSDLRLRGIGFVFQRFFLLPMLTAAENVELPQAEAGVPRAERRARTQELLAYVGLSARAHHRPAQLSGGEAQRVAVARALANRPPLLLADEPTGELDQRTGAQIVELFDRVHKDGTTVVVVTHDATIARHTPRTLIMRDGRVESEGGARVIFRLAVRSLLAHPVRTSVLAAGFGLGVAVMATLLGIGDVILAQARSPVLQGGGDLIVAGAAGSITSARYLRANVLGRPPLAAQVRAASPRVHSLLYLVREDATVLPLRAQGGIPSLERALGDPETAAAASWQDSALDSTWVAPRAAELLRAMDRFHPIPDVPARAASWAEWLYFNGRTEDARFYLTVMIGTARGAGRRVAGVRFQLERSGRRTSYATAAEIDAAALADAPDLDLAGCQVRLSGSRYEIALDLPAERGGGRVRGTLAIEAAAGHSVPPIVLRGASGWQSGYVVPVLAGALAGSLVADGTRISLDGGTGYHDHNWGFWEGVTWQWGQTQQGDLSIVYGRVHPPPDAADPARVPGFLAVLGPDGPLGYATDVKVTEAGESAAAAPARILVEGHGPSLDLRLALRVDDVASTAMGNGGFGGGMTFLQMRAAFEVSGQAGGRPLAFSAPGSAETFRGDAAIARR